METYVSSTRQDEPMRRAYRFHRFSNSGTYRTTHRRIVVCEVFIWEFHEE